MTKTIDEKDLIENKEIRQNLMENIQVLDKVKELILLPNTELMTTKMVSEWLEVTEDVIRKTLERNKEELIENGTKSLSEQELRDIKSLSGLKTRARVVTVFSKRAILNIAMLLRDSTIAKRVRTALLDQQEVISDTQKTLHIDKEKELALKIMFAATEGEKMLAFNEYNEYKNRHINQLETTIKEYEPKVDDHKHFMDSKSHTSMNNTAKALKIGRNTLFRFLREDDIKIMPVGSTVPYQRFIDSGHFITTERVKNGMSFTTAFTTSKGISYLSRKLRENIDKYEYLAKYKNNILSN